MVARYKFFVRRRMPELAELCWATMQGLVVLQPKLELLDSLRGADPVPVRIRVRRPTALMRDGIRHSDIRPGPPTLHPARPAPWG